jgi:hypothetical protein
MSTVRQVLPSAYLAGGAIRDYDNGRPVKDFDVFFIGEVNWTELDKVLQGSYSYSRSCNGAYIDAAREVIESFTYTSLTGMPDLNFVQLDPTFNPADIIERVDFGLCQIGYDLMGVVSTPSYTYDKEHRCLTLTRAETVAGVQRSLKRYKRLSEKYQGWPLNVPAEFNELYDAACRANAYEAAAAEVFPN